MEMSNLHWKRKEVEARVRTPPEKSKKNRSMADMKNAILRTNREEVGAEGFEPPPADFF